VTKEKILQRFGILHHAVVIQLFDDRLAAPSPAS